MNGRRCAVAGCGKRVKAGRVVCREHGRTGEGQALERALRRLVATMQWAAGPLPMGGAEEAERRRRAAATALRKRWERGDFGELFDGRVGELLAEERSDRELEAEIGALRVALAGLLAGGLMGEPRRLGYAVSRVTDAVVRATRARADLDGGLREELVVALRQVLDGGGRG